MSVAGKKPNGARFPLQVPPSSPPPEEMSDLIAERGRRLYQENIRSLVEPSHSGQFLVINVNTGEYVVDVDDLAASRAARNRFPGAPRYSLRIGRESAYQIGPLAGSVS